MEDEKKQTKAKILETFPRGQMARDNAMRDFYKIEDPADMRIKMDTYYQKFSDTSKSVKDDFYMAFINFYSGKKDWINFYKYTDSVSDKNKLFNTFNAIAWKLSGQGLKNSGEDLETAKNISAQSIAYVQNIIADSAKYSSDYFFFDKDFTDGMKDNYYSMCDDTYALILYKLGKYDSAFYHQSIATKNGTATDAEGLERYCAFAEKAKGAGFVKNFLEEQIAAGKSSPAMKAQLKSIYQKENLPETDYDKIIAKGEEKEREKYYKAPNFTLKNLDGENVSLAALKGKVVVLDFWATWCGPCKASFPGMQTALNKYKDDKDVVFLFIDTRENKKPAKMKEDAAQFIKDNKYAFNVVLDDKDQTIGDYKVEGIPTKFIIDKSGLVRYTSIGFGGDTDELVEELSLMIENAKKE
jgi:thiol-disulfide isomerase/thioredoxin